MVVVVETLRFPVIFKLLKPTSITIISLLIVESTGIAVVINNVVLGVVGGGGGILIVLVFIVIVPCKVNSLPLTVVPGLAVIEPLAKIDPWNVVFGERFTVEPICQKMQFVCAVLMSFTEAPGSVFKVVVL